MASSVADAVVTLAVDAALSGAGVASGASGSQAASRVRKISPSTQGRRVFSHVVVWDISATPDYSPNTERPRIVQSGAHVCIWFV